MRFIFLITICLFNLPAFSQNDSTTQEIDPIIIYVSKQHLTGLYWMQEDGWWIFSGKSTYLKFFPNGEVIYYRSSVKPEKASVRMKDLGVNNMKDMSKGTYVIMDGEVTIFMDDLVADTIETDLTNFETLSGIYNEYWISVTPTPYATNELQAELTFQLWKEED